MIPINSSAGYTWIRSKPQMSQRTGDVPFSFAFLEPPGQVVIGELGRILAAQP
jgi:hypothetical protein